MGGWHQLESVAGINWNQWLASPEYAARRLRLHITYATPGFLAVDNGYVATREAIPLRLTPPRPFTIEEVLRIAPAVDPWSASLLVCGSLEVETGSAAGLVIWGLLNLRSSWYHDIAGERRTGTSGGRPGVLTVTSSRPGYIAVSAGEQPFAVLAHGEVSVGWNVALRLWDLHPRFRVPMSEMDTKAAKCFGLRRLPPSNMCDYWSEGRYVDTLQRLLFLAAEREHGACFLLLPEADVATATGSGRLHLKYPLSLPSLAQALLFRLVTQLDRSSKGHYGELAEIFDITPRIPPEVLANPIVSQHKHGPESLDGALEDCWRVIARLSEVDGAVLLTTALDCVGFGCEIRVSDERELKVKHATGSACRYMRPVSHEAFGTRHRSAFRFCNAFPGGFALVVSQDGQAKLCAKIEEDVVFWTVSPSGLFLE